MYGEHDNILRFLALAAIYFELTGKTAGTMEPEKLEEFYSCIKRYPAPEEFHKFIADKISRERNTMDEFHKVHAGGWNMLPPEQRIL